MAGDWIKMRGNLWDDPRVSRLCDLCECGEAPIVGALYWLWATADQHTEDGILPGLTLRQIDRKTGVPGFGQALCDVGWLTEHPKGVQILRFEEHNGASAKRRGVEAQRKANARNLSASDADNERTDAGQIPPSCGAREREEEEKKEKDPPATRVPRAAKQCPDAFEVTEEMRTWALSEAPGVDIGRETAQFRDHTFRTARSNWAATWRKWMRKAQDDLPKRPAANGAALSFRERDTAAKTAKFNEMIGRKTGGDIIEMEASGAPLIASN